jgi:gliding motility-associated-like protein
MKSRLFVFVCLFLFLCLRGYSQTCTLSINVSSSGTTICSGYSVVLTANTAGGVAPFNYVWSTGETTPSISVNKAGTYTVSVSDQTAGCQPVTKSITIGISLTPNAPSASGAVICVNSSTTLTATAPGGNYQWYDAPVGGNLLVNGATYTTPLLSTATTYYVETTLNGCTSPRTAVTVYITGKPSVTGATVCWGNAATLTAAGGTDYTWYDALSGGNQVGTGSSFTTPVLFATTTYYVAASINGCLSSRTAVTARVSAPPAAPTATNLTICSGSVASLHADAAAGVIDWFDVPSGGTSLISSPDYTTPPLTATTTYYIQATVNTCQSARTPIRITVNPIPPTLDNQTITTCYGTSTTLSAAATPSGAYQWYDSALGGNFLASGTTFQTPVLNRTTTYYVLNLIGGCTSQQRAAVKVIVTPVTAAPSAVSPIICYGSAATLTANSPGGSYAWYDAPTAGNLLAANVSYTTPPLTATITYYVQTTLNGCTSARTAVKAIVLQPTTAPTASNETVCSGSSAVLSATGSTGNYTWYDSATGGTLLSSAQVYVTPALTANTTYYVETSVSGCESSRTPVTVTVNAIPSPPTVSEASVCAGSPATLTATADAGGTITWYDSATGGHLLNTGSSYTTPSLSANTTYYVQTTAGECISARTPVTVSVNTTRTSFLYPSGTVSTGGSNISPAINSPTNGTFSASPAGLVFVNTSTGEINVSASTPGDYIITFTGNGTCSNTYSSGLKITEFPQPGFFYNGPYCQDAPNPSPSYLSGASAGVFTSSPAGLVFVNVTTGEINLSASKAGTYTVTNTIPGEAGAPPIVATASVTIDKRITVGAGPNQTVAIGTPVHLAGSVSGTSGGKWSGGSGGFSDASLPNAVYTPAAGEKSVTLTFTSNATSGACGPTTDQVTITFSKIPSAPTAPNATVCLGSSVTLSAIAPGGTYQWYDSASGGTLLSTGPNYITPPLTASTIYYVETTIAGATSPRTPVTVTVNPMPAAPIAPGVTSCTGSATTLTANGSTGTYQWYDALVGGSLLSLKDIYVTPVLTSNTSYYVQANTQGCTSTRTKVDVVVTPIPTVTSDVLASICSGVALNYTITADLPEATFLWSRAGVAGISNLPVTAQTSSTIAETLINTTGASIDVTYIITPLANGCSGSPFSYVVKVYPTPAVTGSATTTLCNKTTGNYAITFNTPGTAFNWGRIAVDGVSNATVSGQTAGVIREVLFNTTNAPVNVTYQFNYKTNTCPGAPFNWVVTVNPEISVTSLAAGSTCSGVPLDYTITSSIPSATFSWKRDAVAGISNSAVANQTSSSITESLINTTTVPLNVAYVITPIAFGCQGDPLTYIVLVNPQPQTPVANNNSPVCIGSTIQLRTPTVSRASYLWTGPNGYKSTLQNPNITNVNAANSGTYNLSVIVNGCSSQTTTTQVIVNPLPVANAGPNQLVCAKATTISLAGSITGGTTTGIWTSSGTGTFSPSNNLLNAQYIPSAQDKTTGAVTLTLSSTSKDDCAISISDMFITFGASPGADAGPDLNVCSQDVSVQLNGKILATVGGGKWSTSGSGTFSPSANQPDALYLPSTADVQAGSVVLTLTATGADECFFPTDNMKVSLIPPPTVNAGGIRYVLKDRTITLTPTVSDNDVKYLWTPNTDISDVTIKNPVITGTVDMAYTLQVTDSRGCVSTDQTFIKVSPVLTVPNTFTPNADGVNDFWDIKGLVAYQDAVIDVFNRYGQRLFHSVGYNTPWDGTFDRQLLPSATYFYIISTKVKGQVISGSVTILR